jgi:hypothetical protein
MSEPKGAERERILNQCHARAQNKLRRIHAIELRELYLEEIKKVGMTLRPQGSTIELLRLAKEQVNG